MEKSFEEMLEEEAIAIVIECIEALDDEEAEKNADIRRKREDRPRNA